MNWIQCNICGLVTPFINTMDVQEHIMRMLFLTLDICLAQVQYTTHGHDAAQVIIPLCRLAEFMSLQFCVLLLLYILYSLKVLKMISCIHVNSTHILKISAELKSNPHYSTTICHGIICLKIVRSWPGCLKDE